MSPDTFGCPECGARLRRSPHLRVGSLVQCPKCSRRFTVPDEEEPAPEAPPLYTTREESNPDRYGESPDAEPAPRGRRDADEFAPANVKRREEEPPRPAPTRDEGDPPRRDDDRPPRRYDDFRVRRNRFELDDEDYPRRQGGSSDDLPEIDYVVRLGRWLSLARQHYSAFVGQAVGYSVLSGLISFMGQAVVGLPCVFLLDPPLNAGPTIVSLTQLKGRRWKFGDFFGGFKLFGQTIGLRCLQWLAFLGVAAPGGVAGIVALFMDEDGALTGNPGFSTLGVSICAACWLPSLLAAAYVKVRLTLFALHLVIDRRFSVTDALGTSWRLCRGRVTRLMLFALTLAVVTWGPTLLIFVALIPVLIAAFGPFGAGGMGFPVEVAAMGAFYASMLPIMLTSPYATLAQTAAYLDAAGTELPVSREEADRNREGEDEDY